VSSIACNQWAPNFHPSSLTLHPFPQGYFARPHMAAV
jgi:hypothetical protein